MVSGSDGYLAPFQRPGLAILLLIVSLPACAPRNEANDTASSLSAGRSVPPVPTAAGDSVVTLFGRDWTLVELESRPVASLPRPARIRFDSAGRAAGLAGCNQFFATYRTVGDTLRFDTAALTKMACAEGMDLERHFMDALGATRIYRVEGRSLSFVAEGRTLARFEAR
jgi:heat shock protein HslJ